MKTLEDIVPFNSKECNGVKNLVKKETIKELAIKWVKEDKKDLFDEFDNDNICAEELLDRWMKRLNITEGDLE